MVTNWETVNPTEVDRGRMIIIGNLNRGSE